MAGRISVINIRDRRPAKKETRTQKQHNHHYVGSARFHNLFINAN
jgi:hypothetical protein